MKPEAKDLQLTPKTKTSLKIQDLNFVWEELEDEAAATIQGGCLVFLRFNYAQTIYSGGTLQAWRLLGWLISPLELKALYQIQFDYPLFR